MRLLSSSAPLTFPLGILHVGKETKTHYIGMIQFEAAPTGLGSRFVGADGLLARPLTAVGRNKVHMAAIRVVNHQILAGVP